jgi:hypothetical protein
MSKSKTPREKYFKEFKITQARIDSFHDKLHKAVPHCWQTHIDAGHVPKWCFGKQKMGGKKGGAVTFVNRMYANWVDKETGKELVVPAENKLAAFTVTSPAGLIKAAYLTMPCVLKYEDGKLDRASQKVEFDITGTDPRFEAYRMYWEMMSKFLNEDRVRALADHFPDDHDLLPLENRGVKVDKEKLFQKLLMQLDEPTSNAQHKYKPDKAKRKIFKEKYADGPTTRISHHDNDILSMPGFDDSGRLREHMEKFEKLQSLNLLHINLPKVGEVVQPMEYGLINRNAIAAQELTIYGVHARADGQHSVMGGLTTLHLLSNALPGVKKVDGADMFDEMEGEEQEQVPDEPRPESPDMFEQMDSDDSTDNGEKRARVSP